MASVVPVPDFVPVGFRFRPTDEELVAHYLTNKLIGEDFVLQIIPEIDVCKHEPWDLPDFSIIKSDDSEKSEWFFFSPLDYKYSNEIIGKKKSRRLNRTTPRGFWKPTGNDRDIKARGTDEIIGKKKTLVFYRRGGTNGDRTNWVIHEYRAENFPGDQANFVLCKLIKKRDEGEPSSYAASDFEIPASEGRIRDGHSSPSMDLDSILRTLQPADEVDLGSIRFSPVHEQEFSFPPASPRLNFHIGNDDSSGNLPLETADDLYEDDVGLFVDSIFADDEGEILVSEGMEHAFSESLRNMYCESSDTDAEVFSAQYGYVPETSTKSNKNVGPSSIGSILMVSELSSNQEAKQERKGRPFQDDLDSSSGDSNSIPARPLKINRGKPVSSAFSLKTCKAQYQPRAANSVSLRSEARRSQTRRNLSTKETYHEAQKKTPEHSNNNKREGQVSDKRKTPKSPSGESSGINGKSSFVQLETPSSSQNLSPPSVYLGNVVIGLVLFVVIIWEMLSCGKFC